MANTSKFPFYPTTPQLFPEENTASSNSDGQQLPVGADDGAPAIAFHKGQITGQPQNVRFLRDLLDFLQGSRDEVDSVPIPILNARRNQCGALWHLLG